MIATTLHRYSFPLGLYTKVRYLLVLSNHLGSSSMSQTKQPRVHWQQWMVSAQEGDRQAYESLLKEITPVLASYVTNKVGFLGYTEDIVQDILLSIHGARQTYQAGRAFEPWMFTIAKRRVIDHLRLAEKNSRWDPWDDQTHTPELCAPNPHLEALQHAMVNIPDKYREAIQLTKIQGLQLDEAAQQMGLTVSALKSRCSRAYQMLRKIIEKSL